MKVKKPSDTLKETEITKATSLEHSRTPKKLARQSRNFSAKKILSASISEQQIKKQIMEYLRLHNIFAWVSITGGAAYQDGKGGFRHVKFGFSGVSDIIGIIPFMPTTIYTRLFPDNYKIGRFLAIECKRHGKRLTAGQEAFKIAVEEAGGLFILAYSVEDVKKTLG